MSKTKKTEDKVVEKEMVAGKRYVVEASTREKASEMMRELRNKAFAAGLLHQEGGAIQYLKENYLDLGKFVGIVTFNP